MKVAMRHPEVFRRYHCHLIYLSFFVAEIHPAILNDIPQLLLLLQDEDGFVRSASAKALATPLLKSGLIWVFQAEFLNVIGANDG